ncbi:thrombospondin type-1 domain-containing protein 4-like [Venturia canescens]|uniref:thrombospondin type-1 domain-containing protein 4-like n=1 Tax=Venturia canescens TaxID=32260 RepID=UPI001C9C1D6D|nr:thrombospondin type-1 domain-containing protein 4-like [Venturia canescens]XP_043279853.1 thrombospondin type-1 domain-containing protein 4-like [Venturia canescens]
MERLVILTTLFFIFTIPVNVQAHLVDGIFMEPTLEPGYHLVATIPVGASNLNVSQLRHTNNYLAVRLRDGKFLLNGNYSINWSGFYKAAGTNFVYHRQTSQQLESFTAIGPLLEPIDVMLLYQEPNSGIVYKYTSPSGNKDRNGRGHGKNYLRMIGDEASVSSPKRYRKRKFTWRSNGFTSCSKTCGGGVQTRIYICIREHSQSHVPTKRCHGLEKPADIQSRCNVGPCPPKWRLGAWSKCSVSCGSGVRVREYECVQEVNNLLTVRVADGACMESKSSSDNETCSMPSCEHDSRFIVDSSRNTSVTSRWNVGEWSSCSTSCGIGRKTRTVSCAKHDRYCGSLTKPSEQEFCDSGTCPSDDGQTNTILELGKPRWLHTEWSQQCSAECGTGLQTRKVICVSQESSDYTTSSKNHEVIDDKKCEKNTRPESSRACSSNKTCSGQWFTGPWTRCSASCDVGEQTREAICVTSIQGSLRMVLEMNCPPTKPETRKPCNGPPCQATWYTSDWTECSRSCGTGTQSRQVKCLDSDTRGVDEFRIRCNETERPESRKICNDYPCRGSIELRDDELSTRSQYVQNDPEATNGISGNDNCTDSMSNCGLVTQARLCIYPFYRKICCSSCSKSRRDEIE